MSFHLRIIFPNRYRWETRIDIRTTEEACEFYRELKDKFPHFSIAVYQRPDKLPQLKLDR